jgi:hypothetical protein
MQEIINLKNVWEWKYLINKLLNNREVSTENKKDWDTLNKYYKEISSYFEVMWYLLKIDDKYWFAYIEEQEDLQEESLSKKQKLSFWVSLFLVILREYLYKKEQEDIFLLTCIITFEEIKDALWIFLREKFENDEKKLYSEINIIINKTIDLWILSTLPDNKYKINKNIRAKLSIEKMQELFESLKSSLYNQE